MRIDKDNLYRFFPKKIIKSLKKDKISILYKKNKLEIKDYGGGYQNRNINTISLFLEAFKEIKKNISYLKEEIFTSDKLNFDDRVMAYCKKEEQKKIILIPDFIFWNWPECGIDDYDELIKKIIEKSKEKPKIEKVFWIGNTLTHPTRKKLVEISKRDKRLLAIPMKWTKEKKQKEKEINATKYTSLIDHCNYKYLIDLQGVGYSGRLKILLFTGRPVFLVERKWKEFFFDKMKPYIHYIPVKEDLSNLSEQITWAENNYTRAEKIAKYAQKFAIENLTRKKAIEYFKEIILKYNGYETTKT